MHLSFKTWVARALETGGVLAFAEHRMRRTRSKVVFALHRVLPREEMNECYNPYLAISPESFDHLLRWLRSRGSILSLEELLAAPYSDRQSPACALTFDDGWEDNHRVAFPILQAHGAPAMIYLATGMVGTTNLFPEERLWRFLRSAGPQQRALIADSLARRAGQNGLLASFKELPYVQKIALLETIQTEGAPVAAKFMDWTQVTGMQKAGHSFGSHTVNHIILPREDDATIAREIETSRSQLSQRLGTPAIHFAFPSGRFDERTQNAVRGAGYRTSVTTYIGAVTPGYNPFQIPRLPMDNTVVNDPKESFSPERARFSIVRGMVEGTPAKKNSSYD